MALPTALITGISGQDASYLAMACDVAASFEVPEYTANSDALGTLRLTGKVTRGLARINEGLEDCL